MRANIDIDDRLMRQAMRSSGARTKRAAVELRLLIRTRAQKSARSSKLLHTLPRSKVAHDLFR